MNASEEIVLNLKLKEDVKAVLSGTVAPAIGYGDEAKYHEYATLFRVTRKHKTILIGNADNVAAGRTSGSFAATYNSSGGYDLQRDVLDSWSVTDQQQVASGGLPFRYTDGGDRQLAALRHESKLSDQWTLNANLSYSGSQLGQITLSGLRFLTDTSLYNLTTTNRWQSFNKQFSPELKLSYLAPDQQRAVDVFVRTRIDKWEEDLFTEGPTEDITKASAAKLSNSSLRVLYSQELRPGLVGLVEISHGDVGNQQHSNYVGGPLAGLLFPADTSNSLRQLLDLKQQDSRATAQLIWQPASWQLEWSVAAGQQRIDGSSELTHANSEYRNSVGNVTVPYQQTALALRLPLSSKLKLRLRGSLGRLKYNDALSTIPKLDYGARGNVSYSPANGDKYRLTLNHGRTQPAAEELLFGLRYVTGPFALRRAGVVPRLGNSTSANFFYQHKNALTLLDWQVRLRYDRQTNQVFDAVSYFGEVIGTSVANGYDRERGTLMVRFQKFIAPTRSNLTLTGSVNAGQTTREINEQATTFNSKGGSLTVQLNSLVKRWLRLKLTSNYELELTRLDRPESKMVDFHNWRNDGEVIFNAGRTRLFFGATSIISRQVENSNQLAVSYFGAKREFRKDNRTIIFQARLYNLTNQQNFVSQSVGQLYAFRSEIPTVGRFLLLQVDYPL